jgi:very-short-patch-repair endonuclease
LVGTTRSLGIISIVDSVQPHELPTHLRDSPFTVADGKSAGLTRARMRALDLDKPFHGVRSLTAPELVIDRCRAYAVRMSSAEFFCSATAAALYGVPLPIRHERDERLHVGIPNPIRAPRSEGIVGHKYVVTPSEILEWQGLRVSAPDRMWCELGAILGFEELVIAGDYVIRRDGPLTTRDRLWLMVERYPNRRGRRALERAIRFLDDRAESPAESRLRLILIEHGLTGFELNVSVDVPGTRGGFRLDFAFVKARVAIEYQGGYHADDAQWRADMTRISRLESLGWRVIQVNKDDLADPRELVQRIRRLLSVA